MFSTSLGLTCMLPFVWILHGTSGGGPGLQGGVGLAIVMMLRFCSQLRLVRLSSMAVTGSGVSTGCLASQFCRNFKAKLSLVKGGIVAAYGSGRLMNWTNQLEMWQKRNNYKHYKTCQTLIGCDPHKQVSYTP